MFIKIIVILLAAFPLGQTAMRKLMEQMNAMNLPKTWFSEDPSCNPNTCPEPGSAQFDTLNRRCCLERYGSPFHCQVIDGIKHPISFCMTTVQCPAGTFADLTVIKENRWKGIESFCQNCLASEFQPNPTPSYMFITQYCQHKRKTCRSLNAVHVKFGSTSEDDTCRCPHDLNFRPVETLDNNGKACPILFDSSSGCTCEEKLCPKGLKMSAEGFVCLDNDLADALDTTQNVVDDSKAKYAEIEIQTYTICIEDSCSQQRPSWVNQLLENVRFYHMSFGPFICVIMVSAFAYLGNQMWVWIIERQKQAMLICIFLPSTEICELVYKELKNAKPLLERLYGPLILDIDPELTYITIIVWPHKTVEKFDLLQFVKDLLSIVTIRNHLNGTRKNVKVLVKQGTSSEVNKAWFKEALVKKKSADTALAFNTGEIVLRFANGAEVESDILGELMSANKDLKNVFKKYGLKYKGVRRGSIKIRFHFNTGSGVFNSLAHQDEIKKLATDLLSHESFKQLNKREDLQLEFICKTAVSKVAVIQIDNIDVIQVGENNHVHIGNLSSQPVDGTRQDGEEFLEFEETALQVTPMLPDSPEIKPGELTSFNIISFPARQQPIMAPEHEVVADLNTRAIQVTFKCDADTADLLHDSWKNVYPMLRRLWPDCKLCRRPGKVWWELSWKTNTYPNLPVFVGDLFLTDELKKIKEEKNIIVYLPVNGFDARAIFQATFFVEKFSRILRLMSDLESFSMIIFFPGFFFMLALYALIYSGLCNNFGVAVAVAIVFVAVLILILLYTCPKILKVCWELWGLIPKSIQSTILWALILWRIVSIFF